MDAVLIVNPTAGAGEGSPDWVQLMAAADELGVRVRETTGAGDAEAFARDAVTSGARVVIAAGGDGTLSEVINGMSADFEAARLAIVPLGTANDFATTLGVRPNDVATALSLVEEGREHRVDLVRADDGEGRRYIINASTGGFSEVIHQHLDSEMKKRWGALSYLRAAADAVSEICFHNAKLRIDDEEFAVDTCAVVVANGRSAGGFEITPEADIEDEKLDVLIIRAHTFMDEARLVGRYLVGAHLTSEDVVFRQASRLRIETDPPMGFSSDGELIGRTPITFEVVPRVLRVMLPSEPA